MKTEKIIEVKVLGGRTEKRTQITTDEFRGEKLGAALNGSQKLTTEFVDHIEDASTDALLFDGLGWIKKSKISALVWVGGRFGLQVKEVIFAN